MLLYVIKGPKKVLILKFLFKIYGKISWFVVQDKIGKQVSEKKSLVY